jgi:hypothetical protein
MSLAGPDSFPACDPAWTQKQEAEYMAKAKGKAAITAYTDAKLDSSITLAAIQQMIAEAVREAMKPVPVAPVVPVATVVHPPAPFVHSPGTGEPIYGNEADSSWGYNFGCNGLMSADECSKFLGVSDRQLDRLAIGKHIRKGRYPGNGFRAFCRRSAVDFAQSLER